MPRLIIKSEGDELAVESFNLRLGTNRLGRSLENDIRINQATISTFHCEIQWSNDAVMVRDLDSTNGTYVNDERVQATNLEHLSEFCVGSTVLLVTILPKRPTDIR